MPPDEKIFVRRDNKISWVNIGNYEFEENDETLTWDKNNNVCWRKILRKIEHDWDGEIVKITTETGKQITVTCNHSIFGIQQNNLTSIPYLIDAGKLEINDYIVGCKSFEPDGSYNSETVGLEKIVKIEKSNYKGKVYDISVEETERFFAGSGLGAHNTSLYPSIISQLNISFDTYFGKIIDPLTYKFLSTIGKSLNAKMPIPQNIYIYLYEMITKYADKLKPQNKSEYIQNCYIIMAYLLKKIDDHRKPLDQLFKQEVIEDYIILRQYFLPMIDLFDDIHPNSKEYNSFSHEYLINNSFPQEVEFLYIIEDITKPSIKIIKIPIKTFENYLKTNNLILSLSGCLFLKHEIRKGLFIDFLKDLKTFRNDYEKERDKFKKGTPEYEFFDMRQKAIKITMNTTYGLFGQSSFRFSNKQLAKAITTQGRLSLKAAQIITNLYLDKLTSK